MSTPIPAREQVRRFFARTGVLLGTFRLPVRLFRRARARANTRFWRVSLAHLGRGTTISNGVTIECPRQVHISDNCLIEYDVTLSAENTEGKLVVESGVQINRDSFIDHTGDLYIRRGALISSECKILTHSHGTDPHSVPIPTPLEIGEGAWIGTRVLVVEGVGSIGAGAIVGAGSVVTRAVPPNTVVAGIPARVVRTLEK